MIFVRLIFTLYIHPSRKHAFEKELASQIWKVKYEDIVICPAMGISVSRISTISEVWNCWSSCSGYISSKNWKSNFPIFRLFAHWRPSYFSISLNLFSALRINFIISFLHFRFLLPPFLDHPSSNVFLLMFPLCDSPSFLWSWYSKVTLTIILMPYWFSSGRVLLCYDII